LEPPLFVVSNWIKRVYTILVWNTISGSSNLDICCYHCLILTLIFHLKVLINFFLFFFTIIIIVVIVVVVLLLSIIYTINLPVVRPRSCRVIYYFDTPALGRRHQSFGRVTRPSLMTGLGSREFAGLLFSIIICKSKLGKNTFMSLDGNS